jgi:histidine triad (HIT) family protein
MADCLFCKIISGEIPTDLVYEDKNKVAFRDINPQAPTHILIIPREHIETLNDINQSHGELLGAMQLTASYLAKEEGIYEEGYRTVFNCNRAAGQTVFHIHLHLLGGRSLDWPPG